MDQITPVKNKNAQTENVKNVDAINDTSNSVSSSTSKIPVWEQLVQNQGFRWTHEYIGSNRLQHWIKNKLPSSGQGMVISRKPSILIQNAAPNPFSSHLCPPQIMTPFQPSLPLLYPVIS